MSSPFCKIVQNLYKYICYNGFIKVKEEKFMKKCNVCGCIVDEKSECPICGNTLTYEPPCMEEKERLVFSKYYLIYLLKTSWFSIACLIYGIITAIIFRHSLNALIAPAALCLALSLYLSVFERQYARAIRWKYNKEYSLQHTLFYRYSFGIGSIIFFTAMYFG